MNLQGKEQEYLTALSDGINALDAVGNDSNGSADLLMELIGMLNTEILKDNVLEVDINSTDDSSSEKQNSCSHCRYLSYEDESHEMVCHNECSKYFGKPIPTKKHRNWLCDNYSTHTYADMSLKEALRAVTSSEDFSGMMYIMRLPGKCGEHDRAIAAASFKTNKGLEDYKDAILRLFAEYMRLAREDGDFKN